MSATATVTARERFYIGGCWEEPDGKGTIEVVNPASEQVMGSVPEGSAQDAARAVAAARAAFEGWSQTPLEQRVELCTAVSLALQARQEELAALISQELGAPISISMAVQTALAIMDFGSMAHLVD